MDFDSNNFSFHPNKLPEIDKCLESDGYVRIQFSPDDFSTEDHSPENLENFFIEFIEKLGGQCLNHNKTSNSFVWHVHPKDKTSEQTLARSQTDDEFPFHTDCSYEENPPEYMALFVLEEDQLGGGQFEIIALKDILENLSAKTKEILLEKQYQIDIPNEFRKHSTIDHIHALILFDKEKIRYRSDIIISNENNQELNEFNLVLNQMNKYRPILKKYTMIILNNQKYLHGRTKILDHRRYLLRIRFNRSLTLNIYSIYDRKKFQSEYLTFSNEFYDYFDEQFVNLYEILDLIIKEYHQSTHLGEFIRQTFHFDSKIHSILTELNLYRAKFSLGTYRPDILFSEGNRFKINGKYSFEPKICEINTRFPFNGYFLSSILCSNDQQNRTTEKFSSLIETIIKKSKFDLNKSMFILKSKEIGYDIHLFKDYWEKNSLKSCLILHPNQLKIHENYLIDQKTHLRIEQCIFELHQDEILNLSNEILRYFIQNPEINYLNDFRTIFILHDKRLFALLSNEQFIYSLMNKKTTLFELIPKTFLIKNLSKFFLDSIIRNQQNWLIKPNSLGKGQSIVLGKNLSPIDWSNTLSNLSNSEWIIQEYYPSIKYKSLNLCGMLFCFDKQSFNLGIIRISSNDIVNISDGGFYIRPYIHRFHVHSNRNRDILTKDQLHKQLIQMKSFDSQWNRNVYISSSGGSGGKRLFFLTDIQENEKQRKILTKMMIEENILSSNDICLNLFQTNNIYRSQEIFNDFCLFANSTTIPMGSDANDKDILEIIEYFRPNSLFGTPYRLMQLAFFIEKQSNIEIRFEKIFFACESLTKTKENYLKKIFHCPIFIGFYGSAETGVFACQSNKYSSTKIYLYPKELVQIEIVNSRIIVTNLIRKRNQLIRFDTGDLGRLIFDENFNEKYGFIEVFHSQRLIMIENETLSKSDFEEIMKDIHVIEWQIVIDYLSNTNHQQISILFRYVKEESISNLIIEENIKNNLQNCFEQSLINLENKLVIQFQSIDFQQLIRDKISKKLLKIIDKRS